jgi:hypothetical protein
MLIISENDLLVFSFLHIKYDHLFVLKTLDLCTSLNAWKLQNKSWVRNKITFQMKHVGYNINVYVR